MSLGLESGWRTESIGVSGTSDLRVLGGQQCKALNSEAHLHPTPACLGA